jgi:hypothetical protein
MTFDRKLEHQARFKKGDRRHLRLSIVQELPALPVPTDIQPEQWPLAYTLLTLQGTPDITYQALRDSGGDWVWVQVATG